jgi:hypothetical protein
MATKSKEKVSKKAKVEAKVEAKTRGNGSVPKVWCQFPRDEKLAHRMEEYMAKNKISTYGELASIAIRKIVGA